MIDNINIYHITWVTYASWINEKVFKYAKHSNLSQKPIELTLQDEIEITKYIAEIVKQDALKIIAYNICCDHIHLIIVCEEKKIKSIIQKLKAVSSRKYNIAHNKTRPLSNKDKYKIKKGVRGKTQNHLWAKGFSFAIVESDKKLENVLQYVNNNRIKHNLPRSNELNRVIDKILTPMEDVYNWLDSL